MATVSILEPVSKEAESRKKEALVHWKAIQQSGPLVSTNSLRIGYHAAALKREGLFGILGYENEIQTWRLVAGRPFNMIGSKLGIAWTEKV